MCWDQKVPGESEANGFLDSLHGEAVQAEYMHAVEFVATPMREMQSSRLDTWVAHRLLPLIYCNSGMDLRPLPSKMAEFESPLILRMI